MLNRFRILIVEDDDDLRGVLAETMEHFGAEIEEASCGSDALRFLKDRRSEIDLVLSDVRMPNGDGISLLKSLREFDQTLPFVFLTGFADITEAGALSLGAQAMLHKPINLRELNSALRAVLDASSSTRSSTSSSAKAKSA